MTDTLKKVEGLEHASLDDLHGMLHKASAAAWCVGQEIAESLRREVRHIGHLEDERSRRDGEAHILRRAIQLREQRGESPTRWL